MIAKFLACSSGTIGSVAVCLATVIGESEFKAQAGRIIVSGYSGICFEINSQAGTEGSTAFQRFWRYGLTALYKSDYYYIIIMTVSSLICDRWLMLSLETLSISHCLNHMASCCMPGRSSMALFTCTAKLDPGDHSARCAWAMAVHHAVGISRQRNSGYRPSRVNIMAQVISTPDPSLSPTHLSIRRGRATTTHYTHTISLMVSRNTTLH